MSDVHYDHKIHENVSTSKINAQIIYIPDVNYIAMIGYEQQILTHWLSNKFNSSPAAVYSNTVSFNTLWNM